MRVAEECTPSSIYPITDRSSVPMAPWPTSNVTLIGDAIYAMSPAAGAGENMAMRDGAALAATVSQIADGKSLQNGILDYERRMIDEGFRVVQRASANGVRMLGENPLPAH